MGLNTPGEVCDVMCGVGEQKGRNCTKSLVILGILAGAYIAIGAEISTLVASDLSRYVGLGLSKLIGGFVFSVGLILVVVGGGELFTGNCLMVLAVLDKKISIKQLLRNWVVVYFSNFLGALLVVCLMYASGLWDMGGGLVGAQAVTIANSKVNLTVLQCISGGILCNWLVCLAVWLAGAAKDISGKILAIIFPIMTFVASGFEHSIANMYFVPMGIALKGQELVMNALPSGMDLSNLTWTRFIVSLIPVTIGNIIGGALFVGTLYWMAYKRSMTKALAEKAETINCSNQDGFTVLH